MKALTDHKGEISCICSSKHLQIIVTGSLDMTTLLHTDKLLTESSLLASINLTSIVTVIRLVPWLDLLLTGSGEGFVSAWNIEDACYDGAPMAHEGEILTMQVIPLYPVLIVCDSYGEIVFWALHPLPYKYNRIFTIFNQEINTPITAVQATSYYTSENLLFVGDEKGFVKCYSLKEILNYLNLEPLSTKAKENRSIGNRIHLTMPNVSSSMISTLFQVKVHSEGIRHLFLIREPLSLISTGYDRRVKLLNALNGNIIGSLHQGISFLKSRLGKKDSESMIP